ncbi:MerR family DNA-binding transcriptional regulator [Treponema porcinum]|uniref:MerR family regulatory protein n=1 Tax=Treponema porcinum TaxID=261392 RepID=A0A1T4MJ00_TREPO|nr:MerR family DNA-binding transcriptional regulator [Treponema porcinum]SJZ66847.1 MerR family regulatory protein [Treponema porcinum]
MTGTYTTSQIAKNAGVHPNTVRKYEEWGLIQKPLRKPNGYRIFTDIHLKQIALLRKAFQIEVMQAGLRSRIVNVVKLSAQCRFDEAVQLAQEYILIAGREKQNAKEAAEICEELYKNDFQNNANKKSAVKIPAELAKTSEHQKLKNHF